MHHQSCGVDSNFYKSLSHLSSLYSLKVFENNSIEIKDLPNDVRRVFSRKTGGLKKRANKFSRLIKGLLGNQEDLFC